MIYENLKPFLNNVLEINSNNKIWELHNDSDFIEFNYNVLRKSLELIWKYPSDWFRKSSNFRNNTEYLENYSIEDKDYRISLTFKSVFYLKINNEEPNQLQTGDTCLTDIRNYYETDNGKFVENGSVQFVFQNGLYIIVNADSVELKIYK